MATEGDGSRDDADSLLRAVAAAPARAPSTPLTRIAHFRVLDRLGEGGMGVVYRAEDEKLRRTVAIKVLPDVFAQDEDRRSRFLREARAAAALTHANIATIHDVAEEGGRVFIVMELVEGESLRERLARARVPPGETLRIARGIARGLARAHAKGIVHRDLKPDNVMLDADGEPKILDFGLAKLREEAASHGKSALDQAATATVVTEEGQTLGTPQYMSPEQARGAAVDGRSDLFSLGVLLYEMLSGKRPFAGASLAEVLASILRDTPAPLRTVAPEVPAELAVIVERCLSKSPDDRFAGARQLLDALEGVPTSGSVKSQVGVSVAADAKRGSSARIAAVAALVAVAATVGAVVFARSRTVEAPAVKEAPSAAPSSSVRVMTDWPPPKTSSPEAAALYAEALQALRNAQLRLHQTNLMRAVALDPHFATAHLRLAIFDPTPETSRLHVAAAEQGRALLDARHQQFLVLAEVVSRYPRSIESEIRAAHELADAMPDDPEAQLVAAQVLERASADKDALERLDRALQLDPKFAGAEHMRSRIAWYGAGDADAALGSANRCLAIAPGAGACLRMVATAHGLRGQCQDMERDARRLIALEPTGDQGYGFLMAALAASGAPVEALRQLASKEQDLADDAEHARRVADQNAANLGVYEGDFAAAEAGLRALQKDESSFTSENRHSAEVQLIELYAEEGQPASAVAVAEDYLRRMPAWAHDGHVEGRTAALAVLRRAGRVSDAQAHAMREAWLMEWRPMMVARDLNRPWFWFYAHWAETPAEARDALAALPSYSPLPPDGTSPSRTGVRGRVHALAGDADRAIPLLRAAVTQCGDVPASGGAVPIDVFMNAMRDRVLLGQALEQKSDRDGACAEYAAILARWSNARPRSVTADKARARSKALGCR